MRYCCTILLVMAQPVFAADTRAKYALFVGVAKYKHAEMNEPQFKYAEEDVKELAELLQQAGYTVEVLLGEQATQNSIKKKLAELTDKGDSDGVMLLGFFGYGVEFKATKLGYYCPYDAARRDALDARGRQLFNEDGTKLTEPDPTSLITLAEILAALKSSEPRNRILLADCCRTGDDQGRGQAFGASLQPKDLPENTTAFFASSLQEHPFESPLWDHGAFARCLIEEITGALSWGNAVTARELAERLQPRVKKLVAAAAGGKLQTVKSIQNGVVDFQLTPKTPAPATKPETRETRRFEGANAGDAKELAEGIPFRWCPAGTFIMGEDKERVSVTLSSGFWLSETELTQGQWQKLMGTSPWRGREHTQEGTDFPATHVNHDDAVSFVRKLSEQEGAAGRLPGGWIYSLPTEAEWEYACRAESKTNYSFGDEESQLGEYAWFGELDDKGGGKHPHQVGLKKANAWGLKDMHGNVSEWCSDFCGLKLPGGRDPVGRPNSSQRVYRGGNFHDDAALCRSACRRNIFINPYLVSGSLGFRLAAVRESQSKRLLLKSAEQIRKAESLATKAGQK